MTTAGGEPGVRAQVPPQRETDLWGQGASGGRDDGGGAGQVASGVAALLLSVVAGAAAVVILDGWRAIAVACIAAAATPWALALIPQVRHWPRRAVALALGFSAVMLAVAATAAFGMPSIGEVPDPGPTSAAPSPTPPRLHVTITEPADDGVVRAVPVCLTVRGNASIPPDMTIVVATRQAGDSRYYFEADVRRDNDQWSAQVSLSRDAPEDAGASFAIVAVVMDEKWARYLAGTSAEAGDTWWSHPDLPPGAADAQRLDVTRSTDMSQC